jgi:choline dehydrogenase-like flavoprotein
MSNVLRERYDFIVVGAGAAGSVLAAELSASGAQVLVIESGGPDEAEITQQTYYRWRKEFGGLKLDQAKRMKELERENAKLKRLVAELSLEKQILKDVAEGNF